MFDSKYKESKEKYKVTPKNLNHEKKDTNSR